MSKLPPSDPRIAPKEMIVTRTKSAQQKRTLRDKDRSMKNITQLLKSPTNKSLKKGRRKKQKSPEKSIKNPMKNSVNVAGDDCKEYYPDKLRRKFEQKRVFLKPHYESKLVVKLNKRKLGTPHREGGILEGTPLEAPPKNWACDYKPRPSFTDISMEEVVRIVEETDSLDDEDLMEILTCPSPVWWEDPPGGKYFEDAIFIRKPNATPKHNMRARNGKNKVATDNIKTNSQKSVKEVTDLVEITKKDDKFLKKRSKLENLLGNIKNNKASSEINLNNNIYTENELDATKEVDGVQRNESGKQKRHSESAESLTDVGFNEELLKDLENMDIPVESTCRTENVDNNTEVALKPEKTNEVNIKPEIKEEEEGTDIDNDTNISITENVSCKEEVLSKNVPINMPRLTKRPKIEWNQSPSVKSISDDAELSSPSVQENVDTISDTNIRFIIDDDLEANVVLNDPKLKDVIAKDIKQERIGSSLNTQNKVDHSNEVLNALKDKKEFITVYKIVSNETKVNKFKNIPEYSNYVENLKRLDECTNEESKCNGQLNSFFKKCKNANRKKRKEVEMKETEGVDAKEISFCDVCEPKKCITVAQDENVKYCLNCSSIFDTDECSYCFNSKNDSKNILCQSENTA